MKKHDRNFANLLIKGVNKQVVWLVILLFGLTLRVFFIDNQGLSNDELSAWYRLRYDTWSSFWHWGVKAGDMHPVGYQFLLFFWVKLFGGSEWAIRSLSLMFYVLNSFLLQKIANRFFSREAGWIVNALYATLVFMVVNTTLSRPYNLGVFFLLSSLYLVLGFEKQKSFQWKKVVILGVAFAGAMLSHYFAFMVAFAMGLMTLIIGNRNQRVFVSLAGLIALVLFLPHVPVTLYHLNRGGLGWLGPPDAKWLLLFLWQWMNYSWVLFTVLVLGFIFLCLKIRSLRFNRNQFLALSIGVFSIGMGYVVSYLYTPVLRELVMLFVLPFLLLPMASIPKFNYSDKRSRIFTLSLMCVIGVHSIVVASVFKPIHFGVFRELGNAINTYDRKYGKENIEYAINSNNVAYVNYYVNQVKRENITDWFVPQACDQLLCRVQKSNKNFFCYVFNNQYDIPLYRELVRCYYPIKVAEVVTPGAFVFLFKRNPLKNRQVNSKSRLTSKTLLKSANEFEGEIRLKVKNLKELDMHDYSIFTTNIQTHFFNKELFTVVCLIRNGELVLKNGNPLYYQAFNQLKVINDTFPKRVNMPLQVPKEARPNDELFFYFWNPQKITFAYSNAILKHVN